MAYYYHLERLQQHWNIGAIEVLERVLQVISGDPEYFGQFTNIEAMLRMVARYVIDGKQLDTLYSEWEPVRKFEIVK